MHLFWASTGTVVSSAWMRSAGKPRLQPCSIYTLTETCVLNGVDARAWLADALARIADHPARRITELLPWNWKAAQAKAA